MGRFDGNAHQLGIGQVAAHGAVGQRGVAVAAAHQVQDGRHAGHFPDHVELDLGQRGLGLHQLAEDLAVLRHDQRKLRQLVKAHAAAPAQRARRADQAQALFQHGRDLDVRMRLGRIDQAQVHAARGQPFGDVHGKALDHGQPGLGHVLAEQIDQRQRQAPRQAGRQAHHDAAHGLVALAAQILLGQRHALHDGVAVLQQAAARVGQGHAAAGADQQGFAQLGLQRPHLAAQCGLGRLQQHGRLAEAAGLGHMHERLYLLQIHVLSPPHLCHFAIAASASHG